MIVHHGVKKHMMKHFDELLKNPQEKTIKVPHFMSTTLDPQTAHGFAAYSNSTPDGPTTNYYGHVLHIHVPKGSHGAYMPHISNGFHTEQEFLLDRGSTLHIHPHPIKTEIKANGEKVHHWRAHLIHDGTKDV